MSRSETPEEEAALSPDGAAVTELVSDIEAELRLHQVRLQEFLEGTNEFAAITDPAARVRLLRTVQALGAALEQISDLT